MKPRPGTEPSFPMRAAWRAEHLALMALKAILSLLPFKARIGAGRALGTIFRAADAKHRRTSLANLRAAFPSMSEDEAEALSRETFHHIGRLLVEVLFQRSIAGKVLAASSIEGWNNLQEVVLAGRGYILVSGHFGNWEMVAYLQSSLGYPLEMVTRPLDNPHLERFFKDTREALGNRVIYKRNAVREMARALKAGKGIAFVFDQNFGEEGALFVPFFGRLAATTPALGKMASRLRVPVLPVFSYPEKYGYRIVYDKPIYPREEPDHDLSALELTESVTALLETAVRKAPWAWFWMHDRWRTRPEDRRDK